MQLSIASLKEISLRIIHDEDSSFGPNHVGNRSNMPIGNHVTMKFVDPFMSGFNIIIQKQSGSQSRSPTRVWFIQKQVAYHLGEIKRRFGAAMDQNTVEIWIRRTFYLICTILRHLNFVDEAKLILQLCHPTEKE